MKSPCTKDCPKRSVFPNCHSTCEEYQAFVKHREAVREKMAREHDETHWRIVGANKIRREAYRKK
jgi:hypothetical protein